MMNDLIHKMQKGDRDAIISGLSHKGAIFRMNAIGNAVIHGMNDTETIRTLVELKNDDVFLDGFTVGDFATAALDMLGVEKYSGNNRRMEELIDSRFDFLI